MSWRNRIVETRDMPVAELLAHPANFRRHPKSQADALGGLLDEVGVVQQVLVNLRSEAKGWPAGEQPRLVDGHLRVELAGRHKEATLPVGVLDLSPEEERLVLATLDPLGALATTDREALGSLLADLHAEDEGLKALLADLAGPVVEVAEPAVAGASPMERPELLAPFPWLGGKSRVAALVWERLGDVPNYVEPFFGSGAVLLGRPQWRLETGNWTDETTRTETANDLDGFAANFWRATQADPGAVAHHADWPVNEADLHARHSWLVGQRKDLLDRLQGDPDFFDAKIAGWWVWGICQWIGGGWCSGRGPWVSKNGKMVKGDGEGVKRKRPHLGTPGQGINRQRPHLGDAGQGINRKRLGSPEGSLCEEQTAYLVEMFATLANRLRRVRICCGDWQRVLGPTPTTHLGLAGVFLDPPYAQDIRDASCYSTDEEGLSAKVGAWAREHGDDPLLRIALCGYAGEHTMPGWTEVPWKTQGGYANQGDKRGRENSGLERIWFSPGCLAP